ncbi:SgrR family transcriptional regulator [Chitinimonas naiadis]
MRLLDQFQRLSDWLPQTTQPTLADIAAALCCSERNVRLRLQRMQAEGWLTWQPGRGRGHRSTLTLLQQPDALRLQRLHHLLAEGRLEAAFDGLPSQGKARLKQSLPAYLGAGRAGTLRIPFYRPLHALDPIHINRRTEVHISNQVCACLTEYDREREAVVPALAHHWESRPDGRVWRLWLRPGLRFHSGQAVRLEDVVQSLRRVRDTPGPHQALFRHLVEIDSDGQQCRIVLEQADHLLLHRLAHHAAAIIPANDWLRPDFITLPVGAGPFRLLRNNDYRATLQAFDGYYRERPLLDEIDIWVVPNDSPLPDVDIQFSYRHLSPQHWTTLQQMEPGCEFVLLNPARTAFTNPLHRLAIGTDLRTTIARCGLSQDRTLAAAYLPVWQHLPPAKGDLPTLPAELNLVTYQLDAHIALAKLVAERFRAQGSRVNISVLTYPEFALREWMDSADLVVAGEVTDDDLMFSLYGALSSDALFRCWADASALRWLADTDRQIAGEPDSTARMALLEAGFARVVQEGWLLPMRHVRQSVDYAPHLGGVQLARCGWMDFRKLWVRQGEQKD